MKESLNGDMKTSAKAFFILYMLQNNFPFGIIIFG